MNAGAAVTLPRMPGGKATNRRPRPDIIQKLGVEYWLSLPLEIVEHRIGGRETKWRVYYALIRCSYSLPASSPFAVRPRLRNGGFRDWVCRLQKRISEHRSIRSGELQDEITDTDDRGDLIPLTQSDLCQMTGMQKSHVSEALTELRADGLLGPGDVYYPLAVPTAPAQPVNSDLKVPFEGNLILRRLCNLLGFQAFFEGNSKEDAEWASKALLEEFEAAKQAITVTRKEQRNRLKRRFEGTCILIREDVRSKEKNGRAQSSSSSFEEPKPTTKTAPASQTDFNPPEATAPNPLIHKPILSAAISQYAEPVPDYVQTLRIECRKGTPNASDKEMADAVHSRGEWIRRANAPWPYILKSIPPLFAEGAWRIRQSNTAGNSSRAEENEREPDHWKAFGLAVNTGLLSFPEGDRDGTIELFLALNSEQRQAAIQGILDRVAIGEYGAEAPELRYIPTAYNYLRKRHWTGLLRPPAKRKQEQELLTAEELADVE